MPDFNGLFGPSYKLTGVNNLRRGLMRRIMNSKDGKIFSAKVNAVAGATAGTNNVVVTEKETPVRRGQPFTGIVNVSTRTVINRPSTAADVAEVKKALTQPAEQVFVKDLSGNGGGGKRGF